MTKRKELSWKPVRRGAVYCAPACGGGCTWKAYQNCLKKATALAKRLGPKWKPFVHENLGWHWEARLSTGTRTLVVHPSEGVNRTEYWCLYGDNGGGDQNWTDTTHFTDPRDAVRHQYNLVKRHAEAMARDYMEFTVAITHGRTPLTKFLRKVARSES